MSMDPTYQQMHDRAQQLYYHVVDAFADRRDQTFPVLENEMKQLREDFEIGRNPRDIEERIKRIESIIEPARNGSHPFLNATNAVAFHDAYEDMRRAIKEHASYSG